MVPVMENSMEATVVYWGYIGDILWLYWDNVKISGIPTAKPEKVFNWSLY